MPRSGGTWKPGQSGNPKGRPKNRPLSDALHAMLEKPFYANVLHPDATAAEQIVHRMIWAALHEPGYIGIEARKDLWDRAEGKPTQITEVFGQGGPLFKAYIGIDPDKV